MMVRTGTTQQDFKESRASRMTIDLPKGMYVKFPRSEMRVLQGDKVGLVPKRTVPNEDASRVGGVWMHKF